MNKKGLIERMNDMGYSKTQAREVIGDVVRAISEGLADGEEISLSGFGNFRLVDHPAQSVHNVRTGEQMQIPAYKTVHFRGFAKLKHLINMGFSEEDW